VRYGRARATQRASSWLLPVGPARGLAARASLPRSRTPCCAQRFKSVQRRLRAAGVRWEVSHMASSWHLLKGRELHMDLVRLGAALYGQQRIVAGTRPAARWLTRIARIKKARLARRPRVSGGLPWQWTGYRALRRGRYARLCAWCCTGSGAA